MLATGLGGSLVPIPRLLRSFWSHDIFHTPCDQKVGEEAGNEASEVVSHSKGVKPLTWPLLLVKMTQPAVCKTKQNAGPTATIIERFQCIMKESASPTRRAQYPESDFSDALRKAQRWKWSMET